MSKYYNIKKRCFLGHLHASKLEAMHCNRLLAMRQKGEIDEFIIQVPYNLEINNQRIARHIVDFEVIDKHGNIEVHETKGYETAVFRLKRKLFQALYPNIPYKLIYKKERRPRCQKKKKRLLFLKAHP